jgi:hypothetical protein
MKINPRLTALYVAALSLTTACSPAILPPPAPPPREMPAVRANLGAVAPGKERVLLDTPDDQARVSEITSHSQTVTTRGNVLESEHDRPLCITPCAVDLNLGLHDLSFQPTTNPRRGSDVEVQVQGDPLVVRHTMADLQTPNPVVKGIGIGMIAVGGTGLIAGIPITMGGAFERATGGSQQVMLVNGGQMVTQTPGPKGLENAGFATLGLGAAVLVIGAITAYLGRDTYTPGATTEWPLPRSGEQVSSAAPPRAPNTLFTF